MLHNKSEYIHIILLIALFKKKTSLLFAVKSLIACTMYIIHSMGNSN